MAESHTENFRDQRTFYPDFVDTNQLALFQEIPQGNNSGNDLGDNRCISSALHALSLILHKGNHDGVKNNIQDSAGAGDQHCLFKIPSPRMIIFADCPKLTNREPAKIIRK